nr:hypothetical protein [Paracoccus versutus]
MAQQGRAQWTLDRADAHRSGAVEPVDHPRAPTAQGAFGIHHRDGLEIVEIRHRRILAEGKGFNRNGPIVTACLSLG